MSSAGAEAGETAQLMGETETEEGGEGETEEGCGAQGAISPVTSTKRSSGGGSLTSRVPPGGGALGGVVGLTHATHSHHSSSLNDHSKISYVNERRREQTRAGPAPAPRPRNIHKEAPDVKHMEKALLELLDDFHTGKLSAFGVGCSTEQMMDIRDQQERLARLHFRLGADAEKPTDDKDLSYCKSNARDNMSQLVQSLEQLSASIEHLHSGDIASSRQARF